MVARSGTLGFLGKCACAYLRTSLHLFKTIVRAVESAMIMSNTTVRYLRDPGTWKICGYADGRVVVQGRGMISRVICQVDGSDENKRQFTARSSEWL